MFENIGSKTAFVAGQFDMFKLISSAYFGKEYYFEEPNGTVYSRLSESYLKSKDEAVYEFINHISKY